MHPERVYAIQSGFPNIHQETEAVYEFRQGR
jgi:hypothetical protein